MYNVEEAYMATIKSGNEQFKNLLSDTNRQIQLAIKKGVFATDLDLGHNVYPVRDIDRLQEFLLFLGYKVKRTEYTDHVTRLNIQWSEVEFKNYIND